MVASHNTLSEAAAVAVAAEVLQLMVKASRGSKEAGGGLLAPAAVAAAAHGQAYGNGLARSGAASFSTGVVGGGGKSTALRWTLKDKAIKNDF